MYLKTLQQWFAEKKECNFLSAPQEPECTKPTGLEIVNKALLAQMALYMLSAPVEEKGYKRIVNLPDWLNKQKNIIKSKKPFAEAEFISPLRAPFHTNIRAVRNRFTNGAIRAGNYWISCMEGIRAQKAGFRHAMNHTRQENVQTGKADNKI